MENSERSNARHSVWLQTFTVNLEDLERCARTFLWKSDLRFGRWGFKSGEQKNGSIVFMLTSAKTKRDLIWAQKSMVTWQQQSTILSEGCESRNNHRYAVVVQVLATQWNPWKTKTSQETENNLRKFPKPSQKPKVIRTYKLLEFGKYYEELSCNHRTTTLHRSERSGIAERAVRRIKEEISAVLLQSGSRMISGGWIPWNAVAICGMTKTSWQTGNLKMNEDLGNPFRTCFVRGVNLGRRYSGCWDRRIGKVRRIRNISQKTECERSPDNPKFVFPFVRWISKIIRKRLRIPRTHSETEIHRKHRKSRGESHGDREEFRPEEVKDDEGINEDFWAHAEARK